MQVATSIVRKIMLDEFGLQYICAIADPARQPWLLRPWSVYWPAYSACVGEVKNALAIYLVLLGVWCSGSCVCVGVGGVPELMEIAGTGCRDVV